jgi:II/X family phage/plasmid replication protein
MIDWATSVVPVFHDKLINAGQVISINSSGEIEWKSEKKVKVRGSDDSSIDVRSSSMHQAGTHLFIDGNPVKFLQGHNLWGTDDLIGLNCAFFEKVCSILGLTPTDQDRHLWSIGEYALLRVDINYTWHLASKAEVLAWIRSAAQSARLAYRGPGILTGDTLYFGKHSRRSSLKCYSKGQEVNAKGHQLPERMQTPQILDWANRALRPEVRLLATDLKRRGLHRASKWSQNTPSEIHQEFLRGLEMTENYTIPEQDLPNMPARLQAAYIAWRDGHDLRTIYPKVTFYRYRKQLLEHGIDIAIKQSRDFSNVVPLIRVLEAKPVSVPDWAIGTDLYFDPPRLVVNSR